MSVTQFFSFAKCHDLFQTAAAMQYDAVALFAKALRDLDNAKNVKEFPAISCDDITKGTDGTSLINYMKSVFIEY